MFCRKIVRCRKIKMVSWEFEWAIEELKKEDVKKEHKYKYVNDSTKSLNILYDQ